MDLFFRRGKPVRGNPLSWSRSLPITDLAERGNRNFCNDTSTSASNPSIDPLGQALRLSFDKRTGAGYFLRAESFFNTTSYMDKLDEEFAPHSPPISTLEAAAFTLARMVKRSLPCSISSSGGMGYSCWTNRKQRSRPSFSSPSWC
jgi:hypothetical protein